MAKIVSMRLEYKTICILQFTTLHFATLNFDTVTFCLNDIGSVADPERFDADPDPTFQTDTDPDLDPDPDRNPFTRVRNFFLQFFNYCFQNNVTIVSKVKLVMCNFHSKNAGGRVRGEG